MSLLVLPAPPWPVDTASIEAAYHAPLALVLEQLSSKSRRDRELDIALPLPWLSVTPGLSRNATYAVTQAAVAGVYRLVCIIAAQRKINVESSDGVDVRVVLLNEPRRSQASAASVAAAETASEVDAVQDLDRLAKSGRSWRTIFAVESPDGSEMLQRFLRASKQQYTVVKVQSGTISTAKEADTVTAAPAGNYWRVIVGGTWDHVHIGHKLLLTMVLYIGSSDTSQQRHYTIGTTGEEMLKNKKYAEVMQSWSERQQTCLRYIRAVADFRPGSPDIAAATREVRNPGPNGHAVEVELGQTFAVKFVEIWDGYGPTITDESLTAIVVSGETRSGGKAVNDKRAERGWHPLAVFEVDVLDSDPGAGPKTGQDEAYASKLSSSAIRQALAEKQSKMRAKA